MEKHVDMSYIIFQSEQIFYFDSIATTPLHVKVCHKYYGEILEAPIFLLNMLFLDYF